jgi:hypothetical protein
MDKRTFAGISFNRDNIKTTLLALLIVFMIVNALITLLDFMKQEHLVPALGFNGEIDLYLVEKSFLGMKEEWYEVKFFSESQNYAEGWYVNINDKWQYLDVWGYEDDNKYYG